MQSVLLLFYLFVIRSVHVWSLCFGQHRKLLKCYLRLRPEEGLTRHLVTFFPCVFVVRLFTSYSFTHRHFFFLVSLFILRQLQQAMAIMRHFWYLHFSLGLDWFGLIWFSFFQCTDFTRPFTRLKISSAFLQK